MWQILTPLKLFPLLQRPRSPLITLRVHLFFSTLLSMNPTSLAHQVFRAEVPCPTLPAFSQPRRPVPPTSHCGPSPRSDLLGIPPHPFPTSLCPPPPPSFSQDWKPPLASFLPCKLFPTFPFLVKISLQIPLSVLRVCSDRFFPPSRHPTRAVLPFHFPFPPPALKHSSFLPFFPFFSVPSRLRCFVLTPDDFVPCILRPPRRVPLTITPFVSPTTFPSTIIGPPPLPPHLPLHVTFA